MDDQRFDNLARVLGRGTSRRTALKGITGAAAGGALAALGLARGAERASAQSCGAEGVYCTSGGNCCSGVCSAYYCTAPDASPASTCHDDGGPCASGGDCCSGNCDSAAGSCFTPAASTGGSNCYADGGVCVAGRDCCSGNCDGTTGYCFTPAAADTTAAPATTLPDTGAGPAAPAENGWVMPVAVVGAAAAVIGAARLRRTEETEGSTSWRSSENRNLEIRNSPVASCGRGVLSHPKIDETASHSLPTPGSPGNALRFPSP